MGVYTIYLEKISRSLWRYGDGVTESFEAQSAPSYPDALRCNPGSPKVCLPKSSQNLILPTYSYFTTSRRAAVIKGPFKSKRRSDHHRVSSRWRKRNTKPIQLALILENLDAKNWLTVLHSCINLRLLFSTASGTIKWWQSTAPPRAYLNDY